MSGSPFETAWNSLAPAVRRSLELAHETLIAGGLAVGSVITDASGAIVAEGRNRAYDPATGTARLERNPLAHAELNALAMLATDDESTDLTIWSTQQPCPMCSAAIAFVGIPRVNVVATDPSNPTSPIDETLDDVWVLLATTMFLIGPLRIGGTEQSIVRANRELEPEAVALAQRLVTTNDDPLTDGRDLVSALPAIWDILDDAARSRRRRRAAVGASGTTTT